MDRAAAAIATTVALDAVRRAPSLLEALRLSAHLEAVARSNGHASLALLRAAAGDDTDQVTAIVAVHALAAVHSPAAADVLALLLVDGTPPVVDHAAWALGRQQPVPVALPLLVEMVADGDFRGMLAQLTLESWAPAVPGAVLAQLEAALAGESDPGARARLVETAGLVPGVAATSPLLARALDPAEALVARAAAVAALGDRPAYLTGHVSAALRDLALGTAALGGVARLAQHDLATPGPDLLRDSGHGLTMAQLFLHADIDSSLSHAGQGDTGGIATLLVHLGDAILAGPGPTDRVLTIFRGWPDDGPDALAGLEPPGHHYASVPFFGPKVAAADSWPLRVAARRGVRRILRAAGPVDVLHLRMADVGSMAAAAAARDLGIPVVLTMAPDPQALIAARERAGTLTRRTFGDTDRSEHLHFRDRLLHTLAAQAAHVVLFPRPDLAADARDLLGLDLSLRAHDTSVVAEGVELTALDRAAREVRGARSAGPGTSEALAALDEVLGDLPAARRGLPIAVSVGRLHRVKGMATLVRSWAADPLLGSRCNLLVVGGDLGQPNDDECAELALIDAVVGRDAAAGRGLLLAGHRPNATVAVWLAAVRHGRAGLAAPGGVYVSASLKEEFGIAILEAMGSGLVVVAPDAGGPATYVEDGVTGVLADTLSEPALAAAVRAALTLAVGPGAEERAARAQAMVRDRFSIGTMASALAAVYEQVSTTRYAVAAGSAR